MFESGQTPCCATASCMHSPQYTKPDGAAVGLTGAAWHTPQRLHCAGATTPAWSGGGGGGGGTSVRRAIGACCGACHLGVHGTASGLSRVLTWLN